MAKAENMQTVALNLDRETYYEIKQFALDERKSASEWIRGAIADKMGANPDEPELRKISGIYAELNKEGREWLAGCAEVAASCRNLKA